MLWPKMRSHHIASLHVAHDVDCSGYDVDIERCVIMAAWGVDMHTDAIRFNTTSWC